jgi:hypothetical protein
MFGLFGKRTNREVKEPVVSSKESKGSVDYADMLSLKSHLLTLQGKIGAIEKSIYKLEEFADLYADKIEEIEDFIDLPIDNDTEDVSHDESIRPVERDSGGSSGYSGNSNR